VRPSITEAQADRHSGRARISRPLAGRITVFLPVLLLY